MENLKISVCLATYNGEKFLREQLESLLSQTIIPFEIIVSDDNSSDSTPSILMEYQKNFPNLFRVFFHKERLGFIKNFERCLKEAKGDFIALCDQDDFWLPEKLAKQISIFKENPSVGMVFCNLMVVDSNLKPLFDSFWKILGFGEKGLLPQDFFKNLMRRNVVTGSTLVIKKEILEQAFPFPMEIPHDHWLAILGSIFFRAFAIPEPLVLYRQHGMNAIGALNPFPKKLKDYVFNLESKLRVLEQMEYTIRMIGGEIAKKENCILHIGALRSFLNFRINLFSEKKFFKRKSIFSEIKKLGKKEIKQYSFLSQAFDALAVFSPPFSFLGLKLFQKFNKVKFELIKLKNFIFQNNLKISFAFLRLSKKGQ